MIAHSAFEIGCPSKLHCSANCSFFGQSFSLGHYPPIYQGLFTKYIYKYLTNRFHVAVHLFRNRSQMTSKCVVRTKKWHTRRSRVSLMFLPHFDVLCDLLMNRRTATWNLLVLYNKEFKYTKKKSLFISNFTTSTDTKIAL